MQAFQGDQLAVKWAIESVVDEWIFGKFYFVVNNDVVGDSNDKSVDLKGCLRWIKLFLEKRKNRFEPNLYEMNRNEVFSLLASSVLVDEDDYGSFSEVYEDTFSRFHISHIGMSSFDRVVLLFLKNEFGFERFVWKGLDGEVRDAFFDVDEVENVFSEFVDSFSNTVRNLG